MKNLLRAFKKNSHGKAIQNLYSKIASVFPADMVLLPDHLAIELVCGCNANCIMCPSRTMQRKKGIMKRETLEILLKKVKNWSPRIGIITHAGMGEPLIDKDLEEKILMEKNEFPDASITLYTNGNLLTGDRARKILDSGVDIISFSVNAFQADSYRKIMSLDRNLTYENILKCIELKNTGNFRTRINISLIRTDILKDNEIEEFQAFWRPRADEVILPPWINWGGFFENETPEYRLPCFYIWKVLMVDYDGTVKMCCEDFDSKYPLGNIKDQAPNEIFNSTSLVNQRKKQLYGGFDWPPICRNCIETFNIAFDYWRSIFPEIS